MLQLNGSQFKFTVLILTSSLGLRNKLLVTEEHVFIVFLTIMTLCLDYLFKSFSCFFFFNVFVI